VLTVLYREVYTMVVLGVQWFWAIVRPAQRRPVTATEKLVGIFISDAFETGSTR